MEEAYEENNTDIEKTAEELGVTPKAIYYHLSRGKIDLIRGKVIKKQWASLEAEFAEGIPPVKERDVLPVVNEMLILTRAILQEQKEFLESHQVRKLKKIMKIF